jgi:hypothetical protein
MRTGCLAAQGEFSSLPAGFKLRSCKKLISTYFGGQKTQRSKPRRSIPVQKRFWTEKRLQLRQIFQGDPFAGAEDGKGGLFF